jgi:hypothetical protein
MKAWGLILILIWVAGCTATDDAAMLERMEELEAQMQEMEEEVHGEGTHGGEEHMEDASISAMREEVTAWIDHFLVKDSHVTEQDVNVHVHIRRRDSVDGEWEAKVKVYFGNDSLNRTITLSNTGDDHHDYKLKAGAPGEVQVGVVLSDVSGVVESQEKTVTVQ